MADCKKVTEKALLEAIGNTGPIFAPDSDGHWEKFQGSGLPRVGTVRPKRPLRDLFTPPAREIARWKKHLSQPQLEPNLPSTEHGIVWGVRPCDARALKWLDEIFLAPPHVDVHYKARRDNLLLLGLACEPNDTCNCGLFDYGPDDPTEVDLMLHPVDDGFLAVVGSEKGRQFLEGVADAADESAPALRDGPKPTWWTGFPEPAALMDAFEHKVWDELQAGCMNCGACTLYCPTCQCFTIVDEAYKNEVRRLRVIDTCQHEAFTRMAGGHNPRTKFSSRLRQRILHKFSYIPERYDDKIGCTGCGRCIELCALRRNVFADLNEIKRQISEEASCGT